jgi:hypothetical protein
MKTLIVQTSPKHTASTLLINAVHGLIPELADKRIVTGKRFTPFDTILAIKIHNTNIDHLRRLFRNFRVIFVCSERKELNLFIDPKYKRYPNVVVFDYTELNATEATPLPAVVDTIYSKLSPLLPIRLDKASCLQRLVAMNKRYEEIKQKPFSYIDPFFELHGSHRNRPAAQSGHKGSVRLLSLNMMIPSFM